MDADGPQMTALTDTDPESEPETRTVPGWEGILDPDERIVWQGRPDQGFHVDGGDLFGAGFAVVFAGFALFWMTMAARMGGAFWMFGLIHFSVGIGIFAKSIFGDTFERRKTWYTLTDRRAFIATDSYRKGKRLTDYPISADTRISFFDGPPDTIHFARVERTTDKGRSYTVPVGFERIADGQKVLSLLRQAQRRKKDR